MAVINPQVMHFGGGVNAYVAPHAIGDNDVQTATNIDFGFEDGAAAVRQGSVFLMYIGTGNVTRLYKHYKTPLSASLLYAQTGNLVTRGTSTTGFTSVLSGANSDQSAFASIRDHFYTIGSAGSNSIKDTGTSTITTDWIKQVPGTAPSVSLQTATPLVIATDFWAGEGTLVASTSGTGTLSSTDIEQPYRIQINGTVITTALNTNGGYEIGDFGIDCVELSCDDPAAIQKISRDYSIGDGEFTNYFHTEMDLVWAEDVLPDVEKLIDSQLTEGTGTSTNLDLETRQEMASDSRVDIRSPRTRLSDASDSFNLWAVSRPQFELVSKDPTAGGWGNIGACRIVITAKRPILVKVRNWQILGAKGYPLSDADIGYAWYETFADISSEGVILGESAPGPPSARYVAQGAAAVVTGATSPTGNHGCTHRILYRSGGYMRDAYAVSTNVLATATYTDRTTDIQALSAQQKLPAAVLGRTNFYNNVVAASEPHYDRIFIGFLNEIAWSDPGVPDRFQVYSRAKISHSGDEVQAMLVWPPGLVVINRDSVYEIDGNIFEGTAANYIIRRTGAAHGAKARRTCIKTPYGIPLLELDGLYMYVPGQGVDRPLDWVMQQIGDAWRGTAANDPAALKGSRVPAINRGYINKASAEYYNDRLWLAVPTGSDTDPKTIFVCDFRRKKVWWYKYPFPIFSLLWDIADARLLAGSSDGAVMQLEIGSTDQNTFSTSSNIPWRMKTRAWTTPNDTVLENIMFEYKGAGGTVTAIYDETTTVTVQAMTSNDKDWAIPPLSGTIANSIVFDFGGTQTASPTTIYQLRWDAMPEPPRVRYWKTEYDLAGHSGEKIWDVHFADIEAYGTGTVTGVVYVDNTAVATHTIASPSNGRQVDVLAFPAETYGHIGHAVYSCGTSVVFKHWNSYSQTRPEPERVLVWVSTKTCGDEHEWKTFEPCVNPGGGTATIIPMLDGTALATYTATGSTRQSFAFALPSESFGRTHWAVYNGSVPLKFYEDRWEGIPEPDVVRNWKAGPIPYSSRSNLRTWIAQMNPRGTVVGVLYADDSAISTATFTGFDKSDFTVGLDLTTSGMALQTATKLEVYYTGTGTGSGGSDPNQGRTGFKHYDTQFEVEGRPFRKRTWSLRYKKPGGATQLDMARFWSWDAEADGTATFTSIWDLDGTATHTQTFTAVNREWRDRIPWPAGARARLWQQRVLSDVPIHWHRSNLDIEQVGIKGFSRRTYVGTPQEDR